MEQGKLDMVMTLRLFLLIFAPNSLLKTGGRLVVSTLFSLKIKKNLPKTKEETEEIFSKLFQAKKMHL